MKPIKIALTADIHFSRENQDKAFYSLEAFLTKGGEEKVDLYVIAGDLFDKAVNNTANSGFPKLENYIKCMMDIAPVVVVEGTVTHDIKGCYDIFRDINASHSFTILQPGKPYYLDTAFGWVYSDEDVSEQPTLLILGLPELSKEHFLADKQLGKAESDEAIKAGMQKLLLGMGATRKQYPDIPCLLVAHGAIAGANISEHQVLPPGGIQIGSDDLAMVGADYISLGHYHLAQQISNLPAYYEGSVFPSDRDESNQKAFSIIEFGNYIIVDDQNDQQIHEWTRERINYPHAPKKKFVIDWLPTALPTLEEADIKGFIIWMQIKVDRERRYEIDLPSIEKRLKTLGALEGTEVEIVDNPVETIRSAEIQDAVTLPEKVIIHAKLSDKIIAESILDKAAKLEFMAKEEGATTEGLHIRIKRLILRGAIGIRKGTGKEEITLDLEKYDPGLIALIGPNGNGKTALMEQLHPFLQIFTRPGSLQNHFELKDSFRDLYFIDERTGVDYRAFLQIDGAGEKGSIECFLYHKPKGSNEWTVISDLITGRQAGYEQEIKRLFGSVSLFLQSAFTSQKPAKVVLDGKTIKLDLSEATKGMKKALFNELIGNGYLQAYSENAKNEKDIKAKELIGDKAKIEMLEEQTKTGPEKRGDLLLLLSSKDTTSVQFVNIKEKGMKIKEQVEALSVKVDKNKEIRTSIDNATKEITSYQDEITTLESNVIKYNMALDGRESTEKKLQDLDNLKTQAVKLNGEHTNFLKERERINTEYTNEKQAVSDNERTLQNEKTGIEKEIAIIQRSWDEQEIFRRVIADRLAILITDNCPTCDQKWPQDKYETFIEKRAEDEQSINKICERIKSSDNQIIGLYKQIGNINLKIDAIEWPKEPKHDTFNLDIINDVQNKINWIDETVLRATLDRAKEAQVRIDEAKERIELIRQQVDEITEQKKMLLRKIIDGADTELLSVSGELEETRQRYAKTDKELTRINTEITNLEKLIAELDTKINELGDLKSTVQGKDKDRLEWEYMQQVCGPDGIQALELDAAGPGIEKHGNGFLEHARDYENSHFDMIHFETQRMGGSGSNKRQIEDFKIMCHDVRDDTWTDMSLISVGESAWIRRALHDAFGIVRAHKTNTKFLTGCSDESDAALDPEARPYYVRMLERAHNESGRYQTVIITHSSEVQDMIGQQIKMSEL